MDNERPIECTNCKKKCTIKYREIKDGKVTSMSYCVDCPLLKDKLALAAHDEDVAPFEIEKNILCPDCKTTLHAVMTGAPFGCKKCYEAFEEFLTQEFAQSGAIPLSSVEAHKDQRKMPLHLGNVPTKAKSTDFANKLRSLNSALHEALAIENYERAADLRDQIKFLMDQSYKGAKDS